MTAKSKKQNNPRILPRIIFLIILAAVFGVSFLWAGQIDLLIGLRSYENSAYSGDSTKKVIEAAGESDKSLNLHFVDVGQGDACIIELPDGKTMIIDAGKDKEKDKLFSYIDPAADKTKDEYKSTLDYKLQSKKKNEGYGFDYAILTHSDEDHCGGMDDILSAYAARVFYRPNEKATYPRYTDPALGIFKAGATEKNTKAYKEAIEKGYANSKEQFITNAEQGKPETIIKSETTDKNSDLYYEFEFFTPIANSYKDANDYSPVMILTYQQKKVMLSGDAEKTAEAEFVAAAKAGQGRYSVFDESFNCDVIKLGHHGSRTSSSQEFLEILTAPGSAKNDITIVSCGAGNSYKHPHTETLERLASMGFSEDKILRTDTNGTLVLAVAQVEGVWQLLYGADVVRTEKATVPVAGPVNVQWIELCVTVWVVLALALLIQPLFKKNKKKVKKVQKVFETAGIDTSKVTLNNSKSGDIDASSGGTVRTILDGTTKVFDPDPIKTTSADTAKNVPDGAAAVVLDSAAKAFSAGILKTSSAPKTTKTSGSTAKKSSGAAAAKKNPDAAAKPASGGAAKKTPPSKKTSAKKSSAKKPFVPGAVKKTVAAAKDSLKKKIDNDK